MSIDELQEVCRNNGTHSLLAAHETIADHVATLTAESLDREAFERNLQACLDGGTFVFLYVVRDLDKATRRVLSYLAEGAGLQFYAVEVDHFGGDDESSILVPRVAYIPANVAAGEPPVPIPDPAAHELTARVDALAEGVEALKSEKGRRWALDGRTLLGVYTSSSGITFWLPELAAVAGQDAADHVKARLQELFPERRLPAMYPSFYPSDYVDRWERGGAEIVRHLFTVVAHANLATNSLGSPPASGEVSDGG
jgi:hypothetical protein